MQPPPHRPRPSPELPMCVTREQTLLSRRSTLDRRGDGSLSGSWIGCGIALTCRRTLVVHYEAES